MVRIANVGEELTGRLQIGLKPSTVFKSECRSLEHVSGVVLRDCPRTAHFVLRGNHHGRMATNTRAEVYRCQVFSLVPHDLAPEFLFREREVTEPAGQF